jgi:hypothetical protein
VGEVDDSSVHKWSSIDDSNLDRLVVVQILNPNPGVERESAVGSRQFLHVVNLAIGGGAAMVRLTVPTGDAGFGFAGPGYARPWRGRVVAGVFLVRAARESGDEQQQDHSLTAGAPKVHARSIPLLGECEYWYKAVTAGPQETVKVFAGAADMRIMNRRSEVRMLCADMVEVCWKDRTGKKREATALLEDICPSGACLQLEAPVPIGSEFNLESSKHQFNGYVRYCVYREIGYFVGVEFTSTSKWSKRTYKPRHLLDPQRLLEHPAK